jgi:AraC-like DNA-binding protein
MAFAARVGEARLSIRLVWIFARVSHHSAEAEEILARENIGPAEYFNPETRVSHRIMMDLLRLSVDGGDPEIGLRAGAGLQPGDFAILEYAARSCFTLRDAIGCFLRYVGLLNEAAELSLVEDGARATLRHHVTDSVPQLPAANDFVMAAADAFAKTYCHVYEPPAEVHFMHPEPAYRTAYDRVFGTAVRFGAPYNAFALSRAQLEAKLTRSDPEARSEYEKHAEELLSRTRESLGVTVAVRRVLLANLRSGGSAMGTTARRLGMSVATLRRRLHEEGTTYAAAIDAVRYDLAKRYLMDPGVTTSDVAFLLGFRDASSFSKAFRRWTKGVSSVEFRQRERPMARPEKRFGS